MPNRKLPRAVPQTLPHSHEPALVVRGTRYALRNISEGGVGLWVPEPAPAAFAVGAVLDATLLLGRASYPVRIEVRHHEPRVVGVQFVSPARELTERLEKLLEPATEAAKLTLRGVPGEEDPRTGYPRLWFASDEGAELVVWYNALQKMIVALRVTWRTHSVFRHQGKPVETEELHDVLPSPRGGRILPEELRERHETGESALVEGAAQFLVAAPPPIPGNVLWQFLESGEQVYLPESLFAALRAA